MKKINVLVVFVFVILAFSIASLVNQTVRAGTDEPLTVNQASLGPILAVGIVAAEIISIFTVIAVKRLRRKPDNA